MSNDSTVNPGEEFNKFPTLELIRGTWDFVLIINHHQSESEPLQTLRILLFTRVAPPLHHCPNAFSHGTLLQTFTTGTLLFSSTATGLPLPGIERRQSQLG